MPANDNEITEARMAIKELLKDSDIFLSSQMGRGDSHSSLARSVERLRNLYLRLNFETLPELSRDYVRVLKESAEKSHGAFTDAVQITDEGVRMVFGGHESKIDAAYDDAFRVLVHIVSYQLSSHDFDALEKQAEQTVEKINLLNKDTHQTAEEVKQKVASIYEDTVGMAQQQAVSEQMAAFHEEAEDGKKAATNWLLACGISVVGFFLVALWSALSLPDMDSTGEVVFYVATRLAAFSVFVYALFFCAKNYAAHRHNYVVNKHRFNALRTYRAFIEASPTAETRNIVLMQAARCIYEQRDSGYTKSGGNDGNTVNLSPVETIQKVAKAADDN